MTLEGRVDDMLIQGEVAQAATPAGDGIDGQLHEVHWRMMLRLAKILVALLVMSGLIGQIAVQALPVAVAPMAMSSSACAKMLASAEQSQHKTPCDRDCLAKMFYGVGPAMETRCSQTALVVCYVAAAFFTVPRHLVGVQIEPEIFPPIALI